MCSLKREVKVTKFCVGQEELKREQAKVNISVCSLEREVKVKVTKLCVGRTELINVNKLTKFDFCIIDGL